MDEEEEMAIAPWLTEGPDGREESGGTLSKVNASTNSINAKTTHQHVNTDSANNTVDLSNLLNSQDRKEDKFQGHYSLPWVTKRGSQAPRANCSLFEDECPTF